MTAIECEALLNDARTALHQLRLGQAIVSVTYEGRRIDYSQAKMSDLISYIQYLEGLCGGLTAGPARRPFGVIW